MKRIALVGLVACSSPAAPVPAAPPPTTPVTTQPQMQTDDQRFTAYAEHFLAEYLRLAPADATIAGEHRWDGTWPDVSPAGDAKLHRFLDGELAGIPHGALSAQNQIDATLLADTIRFQVFQLDELKQRDRDPVYYTDLIGTGFDALVNRNFGTPASRLASVIGRLDALPELLAAAKARLQHPSHVATETAITQTAGLVDLVDKDLAARFPDGGAALADASKRADAALHEFQTFLDKDLLARSDGSFRLGRELFAKKLAFVLEDDLDIDALTAQARELLAKTQDEMVDTAKQIFTEDKLGKLPPLATPAQRKAFVKRILDHVAEDRPTNATIVADAKDLLAKATEFVRSHDLVRVPDEPVAVIEMPEYRRGVAVAYCDSSGPLERTPETLFAISPTPADWDAKRVQSFYREYNHAMLDDLVVHEAMPGHYLQLMHNNRFASKLRGVFSSGAFVEGWAVYSEWLMAEHGFGGARAKLERQKMILRVAANAVLDHDIHAGTMDEAGARALMIGEAFQEDGEATGKWRRARLTSAQLTTYFYGFTQFYELRKAAEVRPGFTERAYHDRLLSWGSPAMKFVRQLEASP
ncbi:MAG TPA: DUF885 domain-containing protein [Kofleriaceae bacterium]|jgi:uncharacterized protein (DUF885 family)|nr:DUF885 domain-containing protein [Kofleriaceae bacterium]